MNQDYSNTGGLSSEPVEPDDVRLAEPQTLAEFDTWMDDQLESLVARWIHMAAPNASRAAILRGVGRK